MTSSRPLDLPLHAGWSRVPDLAGASLRRRLGELVREHPFSRPRFLRGERLATPLDARLITTERLRLRPHTVTVADADAWYRLQSDPRVVRYLPWPLRSRAESIAHLRDRTKHTRLLQADDFLALGIELDGRLIGDVSLHLRHVGEEMRSAEIGWVLDPAMSGNGYAAEAATAMLDLAFDDLGARWVTATMDPRNVRSKALAERLGFLTIDETDAELQLMVTPELRTARVRASVSLSKV